MTFSYGITLLITCPLVFLAGFVDSIAGGGGIISLPAYVFAGIPIHTAYGTNKFANGCGAIIASFNYLKNGCVNIKAAIAGGIMALIGSYLGTKLALILSAEILQICLMVILPIVAIFILSNRKFGTESEEKIIPNSKIYIISSLAGLVIGAYDGFFGPGTGMFLTLAFTALCHFNLVTSSGTSRVINLASNLSSAVTFIFAGKVLYNVAIPCAICAIAGNYIGSKLTIKIGPKFIKPIIALVAILLFVKILVDFIPGK